MKKDLFQIAEGLGREIERAPAKKRLDLQPQFTRVLRRMKNDGQRIPARLRSLDAVLLDEKIEAQFDNMPI